MVYWSDISNELYPSYKFNYKTPKIFGVAVSQKLKILLIEGKVKKEGIFYGTKNAKSPEEKPEGSEREDQERRAEPSEIAQGMASLFPLFKPLKDFLKPSEEDSTKTL